MMHKGVDNLLILCIIKFISRYKLYARILIKYAPPVLFIHYICSIKMLANTFAKSLVRENNNFNKNITITLQLCNKNKPSLLINITRLFSLDDVTENESVKSSKQIIFLVYFLTNT